MEKQEEEDEETVYYDFVMVDDDEPTNPNLKDFNSPRASMAKRASRRFSVVQRKTLSRTRSDLPEALRKQALKKEIKELDAPRAQLLLDAILKSLFNTKLPKDASTEVIEYEERCKKVRQDIIFKLGQTNYDIVSATLHFALS